MSQLNLQSLLDNVRSLPTELSLQDVNQIISTLPVTSNPPWYKKINLNSIVMTTTAITILASLTLYLASINKPEPELTLATPVVQKKNQPLELISPDDRSFQLVLFDLELNTAPIDSKVPLPEINGLSDKDSLTNHTNQEQGFESRNTVVFTPSKRNWLVTEDREVKSLRLSTNELRSLKNKLKSWAKKDGLLRGKTERIIVEYHPNYLKINHKNLKSDQRQKYQSLLNDFGIEPSEYRKIVQDKKYIMVGDFEADGFSGSALGKAMQIDFGEQKTAMNLLTKDENGALDFEAKRVRITSFKAIKNTEYKEAAYLTSEKPSLAPNSLFSKVFMPESTEDHGLLFKEKNFDKEINTGRKGMQIFTNKKVSDYINLDGATLRSLKKSLTKQLLEDGLIKKSDENTRILLMPNNLLVNNKNMESHVAEGYIMLFKKFDIQLMKEHKILMGKDFIIVGSFWESRFNGSVYGTIKTEEIEGSIFEEDFKSLTIFGF